MARLMQCATPYWAGNRFIKAGTVLPEGHPDLVPMYFQEMEVTEPETGNALGKAQTVSRRGRRRKAEEPTDDDQKGANES